MKKIVVTSLKGGSGKTTVATSLAAYYAGSGRETCLLDLDPLQGASGWLRRRDSARPAIRGLGPAPRAGSVTRSFALHALQHVDRLIVDTPAGVSGPELGDCVRGAAAILIPVQPSQVDCDAAARTISDLLLAARVERRSERLAVLGNRVLRRTLGAHRLQRFLDSLDIPLITTLHNRQAYARAIQAGLGLHELLARHRGGEAAAWLPLLEWIESRELEVDVQTALSPRTWATALPLR